MFIVRVRYPTGYGRLAMARISLTVCCWLDTFDPPDILPDHVLRIYQGQIDFINTPPYQILNEFFLTPSPSYWKSYLKYTETHDNFAVSIVDDYIYVLTFEVKPSTSLSRTCGIYSSITSFAAPSSGSPSLPYLH